MARFITECFVPIKVHIKERPDDFARFNAEWTPTLIVSDPDGKERHRVVGFLPAEDLLAQFQLGLAKASFSNQNFEESQKGFAAVARQHPQTSAAPEAIYWAGVSEYKAHHDAESLKRCGEELREKYPHSDWATKSSVWLK